MNISYFIIYSYSIFIFWIAYLILGKKFALDYPNTRKKHGRAVPQIGGIIFAPLFLLLVWWLELASYWYLICGMVSIILGTIDDIYSVPWKFKLLIQLILVAFISYYFWGNFNEIKFYNYTFSISQTHLIILFIIWFVGIFNAVNLLDGLDSLAGGYIFLISLCLSFAQLDAFSHMNAIFACILLAYLIYNQRPAIIFMGDAGSLFLGFHVAVLPLLFSELNVTSSTIFITPFILLSSFLIADTSRVFFTRLANKKNPMTPDTIHFHHLILQESGSFLTATTSIYFTTLLSSIVALLSFNTSLSSNAMLIHLSILMLFILVPPIKIFLPFIKNIIIPFYSWQKKKYPKEPYLLRTLLMLIMNLFLIISIFVFYNFDFIFDWKYIFAISLLFIFCYFNKNDLLIMYNIQLSIILLISEIVWGFEIHIFTRLFSMLIFVSFIIFTFERRKGCAISDYNSLDILLIVIFIGGIIIQFYDDSNFLWYLILLFSIWFSSRFILFRTFYLRN